MAQTLLLGLGGTGSDIVNLVAKELRSHGRGINDGQICCAVLDTNKNDRNRIIDTKVGVPVIPISKNRIIEDYMRMYVNKGVSAWMPESPALLKQSMEDGASQMRPKARLAFMDVIEDRTTIHQLEKQINRLFDEKRDGTQIRVMVVSSLAGGTGSGMFIQMALWLRKYFSERKCKITLRGIFILPDVFVDTLRDIAEDDTEINSLYANAYGAVCELNTITKIKTKGMRPLLPIRIGKLFDSERDLSDGQPVYDYAFLIDNISEGGAVLTQLAHYKQVVARLVYMQLFAPMYNDLYSEEDNLFKRFQRSHEPVFGSCGTAKAIYPKEDILKYCTYRAAQDSLSAGWRKIDIEIKKEQDKETRQEQNGAILTRRLNPRREYIRIFEAKSQRGVEQTGSDRLFLRIANDVKNEQSVAGEDGTSEINYTDKVEDFIEELDKLVAEAVDTENPGDLRSIKLSQAWADRITDTTADLTNTVRTVEKRVEGFIKAIGETDSSTENSVDKIAKRILNNVCPADMGDINQGNLASVFGFLTKKDNNDEIRFVHPIAVRYLLYKLAVGLEEIKNNTHLDDARRCAEKGYGSGKPKISFDNPKTHRENEDDAIAYLESEVLFQSHEKFIEAFKSLYAQHNAGQYELCRAYAITSLKRRLAIALSERLEKLIKIVENFFKNLDKVSNSLRDDIAENIRKNNQATQKIVFVCASHNEKETLYKSLHLDTDKSDVKINKIVARALYGRFCSEENPEAEGNREYRDKKVEVVFYKEVLSTYEKLILKNNKDDIDLDIYSAVCKSADIEYDDEQTDAEQEEDENDRLDIDLEANATAADLKHRRHVEKMTSVAEVLFKLGAPFLISTDEYPGGDTGEFEDRFVEGMSNDENDDENDEEFNPIRRRKIFWGFNPVVAEKCPELAEILGVDVERQQNKIYAKNELDCYRAIYGIQAGYVEKFNELHNGDYYKAYRQVVRRMIREAAGGYPEELIHTPHLDKTWHLFLPYVTPEKEELEDNKFFRLFWLALAYGKLSIDSDGCYQILRNRAAGYKENELVLYNDRKIGKAHVIKLLTALRLDGSFMIEAEPLEEQFARECEGNDNYDGTEFLRGRTVREFGRRTGTIGGLASGRDNNAVTIIIRYHNSPKHDNDVTAMLIQSLEELCCNLVEKNYEPDEKSRIRATGFELCRRIYDTSQMQNKDIELIRHWWLRDNFED